MCGIFGAVSKEGFSEPILNKVSDSLSHRGPDDQGFLKIGINGEIVDLVHRRLSIIDLSKRAHQPMSSEDKTVWTVYNGEVYNFKEIREKLVKKGYKFYSDSDTEVIINSYLEWGIDCVQEFIGMFAFAILDKNKNKLFLFRDHVGKKPLYYYSRNSIFMFASELKSFICIPEFKKEIDENSLYLYLLLAYVPSSNCIFKNTYKLNPGHILEFNLKTKEYKKYEWWSIRTHYKEEKLDVDFTGAKELLKQQLIQAFKYRLVADVPVGVFLSGGIDSTLITTLLQKNMGHPLKTFTIGFYEKSYNESNWAKNIAGYLGTEHTELFCTAKDALGVIRDIPKIYDEPFADSSAIPTYLVSKLSREHVKVSLSGDGGDELFGGYNRYKKFNFLFKAMNLAVILREGLAKNLRFLNNTNLVKEDYIYKVISVLRSSNFIESYLSVVSYWNPLQLAELLNRKDIFSNHIFLEAAEGNSLYEKAMIWDFKYYLPDDLLVKVDRASMANSLEVRAPILDRRVCELSQKIPLEYRLDKRILKSILLDYLPQDLFFRPKKGFSVPIYGWFRNELKELFSSYISRDRLAKHSFFNNEYLISILDKYFKYGNVFVHKLWAILVFEMWFEQWVEK